MPVITGDATKYNCTKPYVPSVQEKGHRETEQTKIRRGVRSGTTQFAYRKLYSKKNQNETRHLAAL